MSQYKTFDIEVNSFWHGKLIKNPLVLFTLYESPEKLIPYPMQYGINEPPTYLHLDWLTMQVTGQTDRPVKIIAEYYDIAGAHKRLVCVGNDGHWKISNEYVKSQEVTA
nr:hypothetical protein [uncultured Nitrososphaera sp.]